MKFVSTRGGQSTSLDCALVAGLAGNGGLFLPEYLPQFSLADFADASGIGEVAQVLLSPFFAGSSLAPDLEQIIAETFSFPVTLSEFPVAASSAHLLELFHGPTAAFKDIGAGFLSACLGRLHADTGKPLTILVATSGDTGGAVAAAFDGRPGMRVVVLYPDGKVSERQARQLTCWGENVLSLAVQGTFDDCQSLVKGAMADAELDRLHRFSSANSINVGRLLPQCTYYAWSSLLRYRETGRKTSFIVPSGNLGNGLALLLSRSMGLPIGDVILATNANRAVGDYLESGTWRPRKSIATLASAMDVGNPSNMERLRTMFGDGRGLQSLFRSVSVTDDQIEAEIRTCASKLDVAVCPHTATACYVYRELDNEEKRMKDWIIVATAHPAKFEQIVEPLIGRTLLLPPGLSAILERPSRYVSIEPDLRSFAAALGRGFRGDEGPRSSDQ